MRVEDNIPVPLRKTPQLRATAPASLPVFDQALAKAAAKTAALGSVPTAKAGEATVCWMDGGGVNCAPVAVPEDRQGRPASAQVEDSPTENDALKTLQAWRKAASAGSSLRLEAEKAAREAREREAVERQQAARKAVPVPQSAPVNTEAAMPAVGWIGQ